MKRSICEGPVVSSSEASWSRRTAPSACAPSSREGQLPEVLGARAVRIREPDPHLVELVEHLVLRDVDRRRRRGAAATPETSAAVTPRSAARWRSSTTRTSGLPKTSEVSTSAKPLVFLQARDDLIAHSP